MKKKMKLFLPILFNKVNSTQDSSSNSFWSPVASTEAIPNYTTGLYALHDKLSKSALENDTITTYLQNRINAENACADLMVSDLSSAVESASDLVESTMNASLKSAFDMICADSTEAAHCYRLRAGIIAQDVSKLEEEIEEFKHYAQAALLSRSVYWSRCRALEQKCPDFRPPLPFGFQEEEDNDLEDAQFVGGRQRSSSVTSELNVDRGGVRLGKSTVLPYRQVARAVIRMQKMIQGTKPNYCASPRQQGDVALDNNSGFDLDQYYEVQQNVVEPHLRKTRIKRGVYDDQFHATDSSTEISMTLEAPSSSPSTNIASSAIQGLFGSCKP
ncbi:hypothetical protein BD408DRAFT_442849 [Parasitella parasitica]|nr:hypothetical protein BD408DRAFT_442849 [Parasitella parasitica]